jgi:hypothetical protein
MSPETELQKISVVRKTVADCPLLPKLVQVQQALPHLKRPAKKP